MNISLIENEPQRLTALLNSHVLDTNISYDDITLIASYICQTPIALVTLIDKDIAHFRSTIGLSLTTAPRKDVFCDHTIRQPEVFIVEDTLKDERFVANQFVANDPHLRFYAGAPLIDNEGFALGTLCVMDYKPRQLSPGQVSALKALARQVMNLIQLNQSQSKLNENFRTMLQSGRLASLGEIASGVAHEVNNPLSVIEHAIEKMSRTKKYDANAIAVIRTASSRLNKIISGLRSFGRSAENDPPEKFNAKKLLENTLEFYASRAKEDGIVLDLKSDEHHIIEARQTQIEQILMNLMQNAFEAAHQAEIKWVCLKSYEEGNEVVIEVADSGPGIEKGLSEKIFDLFYTTKTANGSIGLGLSVSKKLAEDNGGRLYLDPTSTETKFILRLKKDSKKSFPEHWPAQPTPPLLAS